MKLFAFRNYKKKFDEKNVNSYMKTNRKKTGNVKQ